MFWFPFRLKSPSMTNQTLPFFTGLPLPWLLGSPIFLFLTPYCRRDECWCSQLYGKGLRGRKLANWNGMTLDYSLANTWGYSAMRHFLTTHSQRRLFHYHNIWEWRRSGKDHCYSPSRTPEVLPLHTLQAQRTMSAGTCSQPNVYLTDILKLSI